MTASAKTRAGAGRWPRVAGSLLLAGGILIPLLTGLLLSWHTLSDLDIWLHDRAGRDILAGQGVPTTNAYSFTAPDHNWVDHEWLFQILVAAVSAGDEPGRKIEAWNVLRIVLVGVLLLILLLGGDRFPRGRSLTAMALPRSTALTAVAMVSLGVLWPRLILRPELAAYMGFLLAARWIDRAALDWHTQAPAPFRWRDVVSRRHPLGRTFWLTVLWAQFHGTYCLVPVLWLLALILAPWQRRLLGHLPRPASSKQNRQGGGSVLRPGLTAVGLTLTAGLLTPNGLAGFLYPLRALGQLGDPALDLRHTIVEMAPLLTLQGVLPGTILIFKLSLGWSAIWLVATAWRISLFRIALLILAATAALYSQRQMGFFALAFFLVHEGYRSDRRWLWSGSRLCRRLHERLRIRLRLVDRARSRGLGPLALGAITVLVSLLVALLWGDAVLENRFYLNEGVARRAGWGTTPAEYPLAVIDQLRERTAGRSLRLANNVDCAGLLVNRRAGSVFIDGRTEAYPGVIWREYQQLKRGGEAALRVLDRRRVEAVVLAHKSAAIRPLTASLLSSPGWSVVAADEAGVLFLPAAGSADRTANASSEVLRAAAARLLQDCPPPAGGASVSSRKAVPVADRCLTLAMLARLAGLADTAAELYLRGLAWRPGHPILNHNYGNLLLSRQDFAGALVHFERALSANRRLVESRINAGLCQFQLGNLAEAEQAFQAAVRQDRRQAEAWVNLAEVRRRRDDRAGALKAYETALRLRPEDTRLRQRIGAYRAEPH
jgi:Tfp pilus assembly protein PilF